MSIPLRKYEGDEKDAAIKRRLNTKRKEMKGLGHLSAKAAAKRRTTKCTGSSST